MPPIRLSLLLPTPAPPLPVPPWCCSLPLTLGTLGVLLLWWQHLNGHTWRTTDPLLAAWHWHHAHSVTRRKREQSQRNYWHEQSFGIVELISWIWQFMPPHQGADLRTVQRKIKADVSTRCSGLPQGESGAQVCQSSKLFILLQVGIQTTALTHTRAHWEAPTSQGKQWHIWVSQTRRLHLLKSSWRPHTWIVQCKLVASEYRKIAFNYYRSNYLTDWKVSQFFYSSSQWPCKLVQLQFLWQIMAQIPHVTHRPWLDEDRPWCGSTAGMSTRITLIE